MLPEAGVTQCGEPREEALARGRGRLGSSLPWAKLGRTFLGLSALGLAGWLCVVASVWHGGDGITRARMQTDWLLWSHSVAGRPAALQSWLIEYHGEAPSTQVMISFASWAVGHVKSAEALVADLPEDEQDRLGARVGEAAVQSSQTSTFTQVFSGTQSRCFRAALRTMPRIRSMGSGESITGAS